MDESKHEIHSQVDAITAGTASVVNLTAGRLDASLCVCEGRESRCAQQSVGCAPRVPTLTRCGSCVCVRL